MSNKFSFKSTTYTGRTLYALIETDTATIIDGTTAVTYVSADYADYAITMAEQTRPGYWQGTTPAIAAGWYTIVVKIQQGGTPAESDPQVSQPTRGYWTGTVWDDPARQAAVDGVPDALLDKAAAVDGYTPRGLLRLIAAVLLGKVSGGNTSTEVFRAVDDSKDRVTATVDGLGNRTAITKDAT